jgi:hypothetical protein
MAFKILTDSSYIPPPTVAATLPPRILRNLNKHRNLAYWCVSNGEHTKMAQTLVRSAREVGVEEDFHIYAPNADSIEGAEFHKCNNFNIKGCWFKLDYLLNEVSKLDYEYFCWLDADHFFVRKPRSLMDNVDGGVCMIPMENDIASPSNKRGDWWGVENKKCIEVFEKCGVKTKEKYNTNGGLFVVRKEFIKTFHHMCYDFHDIVLKETGKDVPEEYCLAIMGNILNKDTTRCGTDALLDIWACDWTSQFTNTTPEGNPWQWENYLTGEKKMVNPAIVHVMKGKKGLIEKKWG